MLTELNCQIISNEKYSKEVLSDLVTSLEKLEIIKKTIFNRLNTYFEDRVSKLSKIQARINRIIKIVMRFHSVIEAIILKSKVHYPHQKHNYYIPTVIEQNFTQIKKDQQPKLNKKVLNNNSDLGTKSSALKDKMVLYDNYLSFATQFQDIVNDFDKIFKQEMIT